MLRPATILVRLSSALFYAMQINFATLIGHQLEFQSHDNDKARFFNCHPLLKDILIIFCYNYSQNEKVKDNRNMIYKCWERKWENVLMNNELIIISQLFLTHEKKQGIEIVCVTNMRKVCLPWFYNCFGNIRLLFSLIYQLENSANVKLLEPGFSSWSYKVSHAIQTLIAYKQYTSFCRNLLFARW